MSTNILKKSGLDLDLGAEDWANLSGRDGLFGRDLDRTVHTTLKRNAES